MQEKARICKSSWCYSRFQIHVSIRKNGLFCVLESSCPVKASNFNPLYPDLLTLYRRPNPIKIWPTYAVPPITTLYPRSTYDLWRAGSSPTIFQPVEKLIPLTTISQSGPDQPRCILDQHTLSPIKARSTPGIRPNASGAATVSPDGKQDWRCMTGANKVRIASRICMYTQGKCCCHIK